MSSFYSTFAYFVTFLFGASPPSVLRFDHPMILHREKKQQEEEKEKQIFLWSGKLKRKATTTTNISILRSRKRTK